MKITWVWFLCCFVIATSDNEEESEVDPWDFRGKSSSSVTRHTNGPHAIAGAAFTPEPTVILMSTTKTVWTDIPFPEPPDLEENAMNALYEQFMKSTRQPARKSDQGSLCREAKIQQLM